MDEAAKIWGRVLSEAEATSLADPFAGAHVGIASAGGRPDRGPELFAYWKSRAAGNPRGEMRYRWELSHRHGAPPPSFSPEAEEWVAWRAGEQAFLAKDAYAFEQRLALPIVLSENGELLLKAAAEGQALASELAAEALPSFRRDFAAFVQALDPWQDPFALYCLTRQERVLEALHPIAVAIATSYSALSRDGPVLGQRYPFHEVPLCSASAALAASLLTLGLELDQAAGLVEWVGSERRDDGGFGDGPGDADVLTTLVASSLLLGCDPEFDFAPSARFFERKLQQTGLWHALGPEALWLSAEILGVADEASGSFAQRFRFPHLPAENRDHKTGLPFFAYFADLARLFRAVPGLSRAEVGLAFIDLVGFRAFNNAFGQDRGDAVLRAFAEELDALESLAAIRDGGDEFILVAPPGAAPLGPVLEAFRTTWPARFLARFGNDVPPVAPRMLVARVHGSGLVSAREKLGRLITELKETASGSDGILTDLGEL